MMEINFSPKDLNTETNTNNEQNLKVNKLLEYENMVSSAESKCGELKGQLERIKQLYTKKAATTRSLMRTPLSNSFVETSLSKNSCPQVKVAKMIRQNSHCIGTDTTGASLGTINNILAGITKSIQMPELINKVKAYKSKPSTNLEKSQEQLRGVEEIKIHSKSKHITSAKLKPRTKPSKSRISSKASSTIFRRTKKSAIKFPIKQSKSIDNTQMISRPNIPTINKRSKRIAERLRSYNAKHPSANQDLVEIYHNNAVKECKSSESDVPKKKNLEKVEIKTSASESDIVPPLEIEDNEPIAEPSKSVVSCMYKNYAMPTISSKMKQVAKCYMNSFNIKTIPFCTATSTSPSHNIGINIQQVIGMVKNRQQVGQLSPTLAYNIALAAGKWEGNPLALMMTNSSSRTMFTNCPLSKSTVNYQHLQEVAKTIQEDTIEEKEEEENDNSPETQSVIITGPSGDVKVTNRKQTVWTADADDKKCTCLPQKGMQFQEIINKFNGNVSRSKISRTPIHTNKIKETNTASINTEAFTPLQNKERKLKDVLRKLHDEFEKMTCEYDELTKKRENGTADEETNEKLEALDKEMNGKEEEIVMVMTLYKEVLALKQQVKVLKDRSVSKESVTVKHVSPPKFNGLSNCTTTGLLNKLLQQIQHFQTHYKRSKSRY